MTHGLSDLLDRLSRLHLSERRDEDLNPAQIAALDYLARANRFSRMPSAVADYLASTRGTVSQTLKALARKGLIREHASETDKRARRYDLTDRGRDTILRIKEPPVPGLTQHQLDQTEAALRQLLQAMLDARGRRSFGLCRTCRHHGTRGGQAYCRLLDLGLQPEEGEQICLEHAAA